LGSGACNTDYLTTYSAYDDLRKVVVSTATAGTFNAIFEVTAKGGVTKEKTIAITVISCASTTLVEPSDSAYLAALSTAIYEGQGDKDYILPVWTTDSVHCPIESYKLKSTSSSAISNLLCDGLDTGRDLNSNKIGNFGTPADLADCISKCRAHSTCKVVDYRAGNCFGFKIYTHSNCAAATGIYAGY
jgi:hypothetical protein